MADKNRTNDSNKSNPKPYGRKMTVDSLAKVRGPLLAGCTTQSCCEKLGN